MGNGKDVERARCQVCQRADVEALDERLALDLDTVRSMAASEGLPFAHVWMHRARHLPLDLASAAKEMGAPISREQLLNIAVADLHDVRSIARDKGERPRTRVEAHNSSRGWIETIAKNLLDEVDTAAESPTVSIQVFAMLREVFDSRPEFAPLVPEFNQVVEQFVIEAGSGESAVR